MNAGFADIEQMARQARAAAGIVGVLHTELKNACLLDVARRIEAEAASLKQVNDADVAAARAAGLPDAKLRRLTLSDAALQQMADGLRLIAALDDPVGRVVKEYSVPSGLRVRKVRSPLGVILMIYEARPNVTVDAFALCFKAGNACLLKGGREAARSNQEHSHIPTVQHFQGVCHIFVDASAELEPAVEICATAKSSAPAACNAVETVLVHEAVAPQFVPALVDRYRRDNVEVRGDVTACRLAPQVRPAAEDDWGREFLDLIVALKVVPDLEAAIRHIQTYGSNHTEAILTRDAANAQAFVERVQSSCTLVNASTRFNDGFQLGLGAEIGISTSRIHAYGPMGLEELTTQRFVVHGSGQTR